MLEKLKKSHMTVRSRLATNVSAAKTPTRTSQPAGILACEPLRTRPGRNNCHLFAVL
jgi:hypothetical protein